MTTRVLAAGDHFVLNRLLIDALRRAGARCELETSELTLPWPLVPFGPVAEVDEASGVEDELIEALGGVEVCVTQMAPLTSRVLEASPRPQAVRRQPGRPGQRQPGGRHRGGRGGLLRARPQRGAPPPSTRWPCCSPPRAASRRRTPTWPAARGAATTTATTTSAPSWRGSTVGLVGYGAIGRAGGRACWRASAPRCWSTTRTWTWTCPAGSSSWTSCCAAPGSSPCTPAPRPRPPA